MSLKTLIAEMNAQFEALKKDFELDFTIELKGDRVIVELDPAIAIYVARRLVQLADSALPGATITFDEADMVDEADVPLVFALK